ncbi:MAG: DUF4364 family protein [Clostridiales bacterium]|nr:DUF4364 family protein [Clostridiales bacterium]
MKKECLLNFICDSDIINKMYGKESVMGNLKNEMAGKLSVLHFISAMNAPIMGYQIEDYFIEKNLMDVFDIHDILSDLIDIQFIKTSNVFDRIYYFCTENGKAALENLGEELSAEKRADIDEYCRENRFRIINENNIVTSVKDAPNNQYQVSMLILDNAQPLIEVSLFLDREQYVRKAISSWKVSASEIYSSITETLFRDDDTEQN